MCVLFIAVGQHPDYPLVIAANRDEFFDRPSAGLHYWSDYPNILAGRDTRAGGTWLGVNYNGRIAAITNYRRPDLYRENAHSRGELAARFLRDDDSDRDFSQYLRESAASYNPYNLLFGRPGALRVFDSIAGTITPLDDGYHALSNGSLDDRWPKMSRGVERLRRLIASDSTLEPESMVALMRDSTPADIESLPDTGIGNELEHRLSSIFIESDQRYGTRTTSVLLWQRETVEFYEVNYTPVGGRAMTRAIVHPL